MMIITLPRNASTDASRGEASRFMAFIIPGTDVNRAEVSLKKS